MKTKAKLFTLDGKPIGAFDEVTKETIDGVFKAIGLDAAWLAPSVLVAKGEWLAGNAFLWRRNNLCGFCNPARSRASQNHE